MNQELSWGQKLKRLRESLGMTQDELAHKSGLGRNYIGAAETDEIEHPGFEKMSKLAMGTGKSLSQLNRELFSVADPQDAALPKESDTVIRIPIIGSVPAGYPDIREEQPLGYLIVAREEMRGISPGGLYALKITGESLSGDNIHDADYVIYDVKNREVVNGKIYVCRIENEVAIKHVYLENSHVRLVSSNPHFKDITPASVEILGRAVLGGRYHEL